MSHEDDFERRLEAELSRAEPYIDDGGFTDRVLQRLPPRRARRRTPLILGAAALGTVAALLSPAGGWLGRTTALVVIHRSAPVPIWIALAAVLGMLVWSSLVAARQD